MNGTRVDGQTAAYREWENVLKARRTLVKAKNATHWWFPKRSMWDAFSA
jgi:hypothetical protein